MNGSTHEWNRERPSWTKHYAMDRGYVWFLAVDTSKQKVKEREQGTCMSMVIGSCARLLVRTWCWAVKWLRSRGQGHCYPLGKHVNTNTGTRVLYTVARIVNSNDRAILLARSNGPPSHSVFGIALFSLTVGANKATQITKYCSLSIIASAWICFTYLPVSISTK
jgi:hypothetical protein